MESSNQPQNRPPTPKDSREPEHQGSIWSHPYMLYIWITVIIFAVLLSAGYLAVTQGWIPHG